MGVYIEISDLTGPARGGGGVRFSWGGVVHSVGGGGVH